MKSLPKENKLIAAIWFLLATGLAGASLVVLFTGGLHLTLPLIALALVIFLVGRQRVDRLKIEVAKFNRLLLVLSLFVVFSSIIGVA